MATTLYWMQAGGCGGDSLSLLSAETPDLVEALEALDLDLLWHPSLSIGPEQKQKRLRQELVSGQRPLDILCVEGAVILGPDGSGMFDACCGRPRKDHVLALARSARYVVAVGTCACFGGITASSDVGATGLQFLRDERGGFLGPDFRSKAGLPVINLPGCPTHPTVTTSILALLANGRPMGLTELQSPADWYGVLVHQGCTRNEYHEYRVEEMDFGERGCLFFHMGCKGPLARAPCNKLLWNRRSSKTRVGVPCFGCASPDFPQGEAFFQTPNIEGLPITLPDGVDRAHYMAYKGMAAAAAPERLKVRETEV